MTTQAIPEQMRAAAIDHFGGPDVIQMRSLPVPKCAADEVLIRLQSAGIGVWDPAVREGKFDTGKVRFPRVIGNDGAGTVVATGARAKHFHIGDSVYAFSMEGGFYAEYVAVKEDNVAAIPAGVTADEAGALGADGITALCGLQDQLHLEAGEALMIFGASGGIGHIAVQLAKRIGAFVLAVASGEDGVNLVKRLGADLAVDGRVEDVARAAREFAPNGLDAALVLTYDEELRQALTAVRRGGRVAHPNGVEPTPTVPKGVKLLAYDGDPDRDTFDRLNRLIGSKPFHVELGHVYRLEDAGRAHRELARHHLGKLAFRVDAH